MNVIALIANLVFPGVGTIIVGKTGVGIIQLILYILGLIFSFTLIGAIVGIPMVFVAWVWGIISVVRR